MSQRIPKIINIKIEDLISIGEEIFKNARARNELEAKSINDFIRNKSKIIKEYK